MAEETFLPPTDPDYVFPLGYVTSTVETPTRSGRVQARARMHQPLRRFKMRWENTDFTNARYLTGFFAAMKGKATKFRWNTIDETLYWPEYPLKVTTGSTTSGALAGRSYYVAFSWSNASGETRTSPAKLVSIAANDVLTVTVPEFPRYATGAKIYVGTTAAGMTLQTTVTTSRGSWTEPDSGLVSGAAFVSTSTFQENILVRFGQHEFEPRWKPGQIADCELILEEVSGV